MQGVFNARVVYFDYSLDDFFGRVLNARVVCFDYSIANRREGEGG